MSYRDNCCDNGQALKYYSDYIVVHLQKALDADSFAWLHHLRQKYNVTTVLAILKRQHKNVEIHVYGNIESLNYKKNGNLF